MGASDGVSKPRSNSLGESVHPRQAGSQGRCCRGVCWKRTQGAARCGFGQRDQLCDLKRKPYWRGVGQLSGVEPR